METEERVANVRKVGVFTISLDFELIWGTLDLFGPERFRRACEIEREEVIDRLLDLFAEYEVSATWCTLGHLFHDACQMERGHKHPMIVRPTHSWHQEDWFFHDPCSTEESAPLFYGRSLIQKIRDCQVPQEIGCHSYSHVIFGDPGCSRETALSEISTCVNLAREVGVELRAFAFPRNCVGHLDVLHELGFTCYRGPEPIWYEQGHTRGTIERLTHLWDVVRAAEPPVVEVEISEAGLRNIPASMIFFPMDGLRRFIPMSLRVRRAIKGLDAAVRQRRIFHFWFHPTNMATHIEKMFGGLHAILEHASRLRERGVLSILPMTALASSEQHPSETPFGSSVESAGVSRTVA